MRYIIFASDHWNTLGVLRCLGENGINPEIILVEDDRKGYLVKSSKYCKDIKRFTSIDEGFKYLLSILPIYDEDRQDFWDLPILLTGMDRIQVYLDIHSQELKGRCHFFNSAIDGGIRKLMDKSFQNEMAKNCGLTPIKSIVIEKEIPFTNNLDFPILTKSINSESLGWKNSMHICNSDEELKSAIDSIQDKKIMLQEFIDKKNELAVMGISYNDGKNVVIPLSLSYLRSTPGAYGTYIYIERLFDQTLRNKIQAFMQKCRFNGIFEIEFIIDKNDKLWFMETNFRISAWVHGYADYGFNMPVLYGKVCSGENINDVMVMDRERRFKGILEPSDFVAHVIPHHVGLWRWLKDLKGADTYFFYDKNDKKPFFSMVYKNLFKFLKR